MADATRWVTDDGREFIGDQVHITWETAGEHTVTQHLRSGATVVHTVTTTERPQDVWPVAEGRLHPGLVPHTGHLRPREVGGLQADGVTPVTEVLPDVALYDRRGPVSVSYDRTDPSYRFATDFDAAGTMDWPDLLDTMIAGVPQGQRVTLVLDHAPAAGQDWHVYPHSKPGFSRGRAACYSIPVGSPIAGIVGEGRQALAGPTKADDTRLFEVWSRNSAVDQELAGLGITPDAQGKLWATAKQMGNIQAKGGQAECRLIEVLASGVTLANLALIEPGGRPDGDVDVLGTNGIRIDRASDTVLSHLLLRGSSKGWAGEPPGETAQIAVVGVTGRLVRADCIVDGARADGTRVAGSPFSVAACTVPAESRWLDERNIERGNRASMHTYWNSNVCTRRLDLRTERSAGPHTNEEDFNWRDGYHMLTIGDDIDVVSKYDKTGTSTAGTMQITCTAGPRAKDTHKSNQTWVNWRTRTPGALQHWATSAASATDVLSIQSSLSYQGVDSTMGATGPQELRVDGVTPPMGWRAWYGGRWQSIVSNKDEMNTDGTLRTPTAPDRAWPTDIGTAPDKKVAVYR